MTFGEELLEELGDLIPVDSYLNAEQQEQLKQIESKDDLKEFLLPVLDVKVVNRATNQLHRHTGRRSATEVQSSKLQDQLRLQRKSHERYELRLRIHR